MQLFIQRQNILCFQKQLAEQPSESQRLLLLKLLAEEVAKPGSLPGAQQALA